MHGELCSTLYIRVCAAGIGEENKEGRGGTAKDDDEYERRLSSLDVGCSPLYKPMVSTSCCTSARISALLRYFVSSLVLSFLRSLVLVRSLVRSYTSLVRLFSPSLPHAAIAFPRLFPVRWYSSQAGSSFHSCALTSIPHRQKQRYSSPVSSAPRSSTSLPRVYTLLPTSSPSLPPPLPPADLFPASPRARLPFACQTPLVLLIAEPCVSAIVAPSSRALIAASFILPP